VIGQPENINKKNNLLIKYKIKIKKIRKIR